MSLFVQFKVSVEGKKPEVTLHKNKINSLALVEHLIKRTRRLKNQLNCWARQQKALPFKFQLNNYLPAFIIRPEQNLPVVMVLMGEPSSTELLGHIGPTSHFQAVAWMFLFILLCLIGLDKECISQSGQHCVLAIKCLKSASCATAGWPQESCWITCAGVEVVFPLWSEATLSMDDNYRRPWSHLSCDMFITVCSLCRLQLLDSVWRRMVGGQIDKVVLARKTQQTPIQSWVFAQPHTGCVKGEQIGRKGRRSPG